MHTQSITDNASSINSPSVSTTPEVEKEASGKCTGRSVKQSSSTNTIPSSSHMSSTPDSRLKSTKDKNTCEAEIIALEDAIKNNIHKLKNLGVIEEPKDAAPRHTRHSAKMSQDKQDKQEAELKKLIKNQKTKRTKLKNSYDKLCSEENNLKKSPSRKRIHLGEGTQSAAKVKKPNVINQHPNGGDSGAPAPSIQKIPNVAPLMTKPLDATETSNSSAIDLADGVVIDLTDDNDNYSYGEVTAGNSGLELTNTKNLTIKQEPGTIKQEPGTIKQEPGTIPSPTNSEVGSTSRELFRPGDADIPQLTRCLNRKPCPKNATENELCYLSLITAQIEEQRNTSGLSSGSAFTTSEVGEAVQAIENKVTTLSQFLSKTTTEIPTQLNRFAFLIKAQINSNRDKCAGDDVDIVPSREEIKNVLAELVHSLGITKEILNADISNNQTLSKPNESKAISEDLKRVEPMKQAVSLLRGQPANAQLTTPVENDELLFAASNILMKNIDDIAQKNKGSKYAELLSIARKGGVKAAWGCVAGASGYLTTMNLLAVGAAVVSGGTTTPLIIILGQAGFGVAFGSASVVSMKKMISNSAITETETETETETASTSTDLPLNGETGSFVREKRPRPTVASTSQGAPIIMRGPINDKTGAIVVANPSQTHPTTTSAANEAAGSAPSRENSASWGVSNRFRNLLPSMPSIPSLFTRSSASQSQNRTNDSANETTGANNRGK